MYNDRAHEGRAHYTRCKLRIFPPRTSYWRSAHSATAQKAFFNAETGNAFTTVLAGLALTMTTFPKTSLLPAFVAGFKRVLIMHRPGSTNLPALFTCCVPISAKPHVLCV